MKMISSSSSRLFLYMLHVERRLWFRIISLKFLLFVLDNPVSSSGVRETCFPPKNRLHGTSDKLRTSCTLIYLSTLLHINIVICLFFASAYNHTHLLLLLEQVVPLKMELVDLGLKRNHQNAPLSLLLSSHLHSFHCTQSKAPSKITPTKALSLLSFYSFVFAFHFHTRSIDLFQTNSGESWGGMNRFALTWQSRAVFFN